MRMIFIGDVHGCLDEFQELVGKIKPGPDDQVFCVGDFMDRGPDPVGCVQFARASGFSSVLGNHEDKHLRWRKHEAKRASDATYKNPMQSLKPERLAQNAALTDSDVAWLESLPVVLEPCPEWVLVHGGLLPGITLQEQVQNKKRRNEIVRLRWVDAAGEFVPLEDDTAADGPSGSVPWMTAYDGPYNVVYGHAVHGFTDPRVDKRPHGVRTYGIDTGCVFGGRLTALVLEGKMVTFEQVRAKRVYHPFRTASSHNA